MTFHVNGTGKVSSCGAKSFCVFGRASEHYSTKQEAQAAKLTLKLVPGNIGKQFKKFMKNGNCSCVLVDSAKAVNGAYPFFDGERNAFVLKVCAECAARDFLRNSHYVSRSYGVNSKYSHPFPEALAYLAFDSFYLPRYEVAANEATPDYVFKILANDRDARIRYALLENKSVDASLKAFLLQTPEFSDQAFLNSVKREVWNLKVHKNMSVGI